jgi:glycosyltransferase involved in cell wall biosynthesis
MKQIKLLFDATVIADVCNSKNSLRSGIYFVAYNLLQQFNQHPFFKVTLLISSEINNSIKFGSKNIFTRYPTIKYYGNRGKEIYKKNILIHEKIIKESTNLVIIFIRYLKIIKNYLQIILHNNYFANMNFDVFFSPIFTIPDEIKENTSLKIYNVLYDCIPVLKNIPHPLLSSEHWFSKLVLNLNKETFYFCISECTRNDFLTLFPNQLDAKKMFVTPIATSQNFSPIYNKILLNKVLRKFNITQRLNDNYIFSLSTIDPRKNQIFTIKCFLKFIKNNNIHNLYFYIGGGYFTEFIDQFKHEISAFGEYADKIISLGYLDDEDVNILYSNSLFFTFLSQYEGFGIPPLEAMQSGTPVICSNNSSLPEVVGDAAVMIDYNSEEQCIKAFEDFYFKEDLRNEYVKRGIERAKLFTWEKTVTKMAEVITKQVKGVILA